MHFLFTFKLAIDQTTLINFDHYCWTQHKVATIWSHDNQFSPNWIDIFVDTEDPKVLEDIKHYYNHLIAELDDDIIDKPANFNKGTMQ